MTELAIFASTFAVVFFLGVQSLNVNGGHYLAAALTSLGIGASHLVLYKTVPDANTTQMIAYLAGGPLGIVCAMWAHGRIKAWFNKPHAGEQWTEGEHDMLDCITQHYRNANDQARRRQSFGAQWERARKRRAHNPSHGVNR